MTAVSRLYAKSAAPGHRAETLTDHLIATAASADVLRRRVGDIPLARQVLPRGLWDLIQQSAICHDLGKVAGGFQTMVTGSGRGWGHRHELLSLGFLPTCVPDQEQRMWIASAILTHHRPLANDDRSITGQYAGLSVSDLRADLGDIDGGSVTDLHAWVSQRQGFGPPPPNGIELISQAHSAFNDVRVRWADGVDPDTGLVAVLIQGGLILADHLASAHATPHVRQPIDGSFPDRIAARFGGANMIHPHQRACQRISGHVTLRSPTGSGKTEAGLLWASTQLSELMAAGAGAPRLFVTLPYLASINAMAQRLGTLLGDHDLIGVAHSRAASYHLANALGPDGGAPTAQAARQAVSRAAATRLFRESVRVATPYQLLRAAIAGPAHASTLVDLANSVVILDEPHAYDARRLGYILASAHMWERLGCRIAILSATLPTALAEVFRQSLDQPVTTVIGPPGPARHRIGIRDQALTDGSILAEVVADLEQGRAVLVVANNVAHARELFDDLAPLARSHAGGDPEAALLLHSRFKRGDRAAIEHQLNSRYGLGTPRQPGLVVATQVVEVSLDIDLDTLYTSGAPLEATLQRFGRVNRCCHRPPADVVICQPSYDPRRGGEPGARYADGVYEAEPVRLGLEILRRHAGQAVDESETTRWLDEVYASPWGERWRHEVERARQVFERDFLSFSYPLDGRERMEERFDQLFDGTEAIMASDRDAYAARLGRAPSAADRLLGEELLIPLPHWATGIVSYDKRLRVRIVDGDYDPQRGLLDVRPRRNQPVYQLGEIL